MWSSRPIDWITIVKIGVAATFQRSGAQHLDAYSHKACNPSANAILLWYRPLMVIASLSRDRPINAFVVECLLHYSVRNKDINSVWSVVNMEYCTISKLLNDAHLRSVLFACCVCCVCVLSNTKSTSSPSTNAAQSCRSTQQYDNTRNASIITLQERTKWHVCGVGISRLVELRFFLWSFSITVVKMLSARVFVSLGIAIQGKSTDHL